MTTSPSTPLVADHAAPLTKQAVFDIAWRWSRTHPRCGGPDCCLYRTEDRDNACLMGATIPDSLYEPKMEGQDAASVSVGLRLRGLYTEEVTGEWLNTLQDCHDKAFALLVPYPEDVANRLTAFARLHNLTIPSEDSHHG